MPKPWRLKVETLVQSLQERMVKMESDLKRNTIQLRTQQLDEVRQDQHKNKLVKEDTSTLLRVYEGRCTEGTET